MTDHQYRYPAAKIIVFAKEPVAGKVKTRLAKSIGETAALQFYEEMLRLTLQMACREQLAKVELHVSGNPEHELIQSLSREYNISVHPQMGENLGERMFYALQRSLQNSNYGILIGTDCPVMEPDYLSRALSALAAGEDVVLGPAEDGGYVLVGARRVDIDWFSDISWGSHLVLQQSRLKISNSGAALRELPVLWDVDHLEDLHRWHITQ